MHRGTDILTSGNRWFIEQAGLSVWPDELVPAIRMQVIRGIPSDAVKFGRKQTTISKAR